MNERIRRGKDLCVLTLHVGEMMHIEPVAVIDKNHDLP